MQNPEPSGKKFWIFTLIIAAILILLRIFVFGPFLVVGSSMEPTFYTGDYLIVDKLTYQLQAPQRGDVIVLVPPIAGDEGDHFIKRIVGLPGETIVVTGPTTTITSPEHPNGIQITEPYVKYPSDRDATYTLNSDQYFVMGDNRAVSSDSRIWGPITREAITGKAFMRLYPLDKISVLPGQARYPTQ